MFFGISVKNNEKKFLGSKSDLGTIDPLGPKVTFRPHQLFYVNFDTDSEKHIFSPFGDTFEILMVLKTLGYLKFFFCENNLYKQFCIWENILDINLSRF